MRVLTVAAAAVAAGAIAFGALTAAETQTASAQSAYGFAGKAIDADPGKPGQWEIACETDHSAGGFHVASLDHLQPGQCHLRYVDVFTTGDGQGGHTTLGVVGAFITPDKEGMRVEFGITPGLSFDIDGFYLSRDDFTVWRLDKYGCLSEGICTFSGPAAEALIAAFSDRSAATLEMRLDFTDESGQHHHRQWQMMPFSGAYADFLAKQVPAAM